VDEKLGWTPLYRTVICSNIEATKFLLENGANPNIKNRMGEGPLHPAADNKEYQIVMLLLSNSAEPNI
jgi:ankyrin repeat protein